MPAPTTSTIGTGGTYTTLAAWLADMPADITTGGGAGNYSALLKNQDFSVAGTVLTLTGITTDATHGITIGCDAGASFRNHASAATNPLRFNASNGAAVTCTAFYDPAIKIGCNYVTLFGLQVRNSTFVGAAVSMVTLATHVIFDSCIFRNSGSGPTIATGFAGSIVRNCLVQTEGSGGTGISVGDSSVLVQDTTVVRTADQAAAGTGIALVYSGATVTGCAIFGFTNATSGTLNVLSDYNATDQSSLGAGYPATTHNLVSQTYSGCFQNTGSTPANADFQIGASSPLKDAGTTISGITTDIIGQTRSSPDIGAWEYFSASTATSYTFTGPSTGVVSVASTNFTVTPVGGTSTVTITPHSTGSGTFTPTSVTFTGTPAKTFTYTPSSTTGSPHTITVTASPALGTDPTGIAYTVSAAPLTATAITCTPAKTSLAVATTVSGGTAPYTKQWSSSTSRTGTFTNFGTDSLSATLSGLTYRRYYWIKCTVTDAASGTTTVGPTAFATRPPHSIALGLSGDSITGYITGTSITANLIGSSATSSYASIPSPDNQAAAGSASADWLPTAANWPLAPISGVSNLYTYATNSWATTLAGQTVKIVHTMLGTNDAFFGVSAATYRANMSTICNTLVALGYRVVLSYPSFRTDNLTLNDTILLYHAQIDSLVDNVGIFQGDQDAFGIFANGAATLLADGLHPTIAGQNAFHKLWADAISRVMEREGHAVPSSGGGAPLIGGGLVR